MSQAAITICASLLCVALFVFILACAAYWVAQAIAVMRGVYAEQKGDHDDSGDDGGADYWKRGGRK